MFKKLLILAFLMSLCMPQPALGIVGAEDKVTGKSPRELEISADLMPDVSSPQGILMSSEGTVLWEREADQPRPIGGLNAIMAATVALESEVDLDELVTVPSASPGFNPSELELSAGDRIAFKDLIYLTLVRPTPMSALMLSEKVSGKSQAFVELMNMKASELGLENTHFADVFGKDNPDNYSSARDLANLSRYAMQNEDFRSAVASKIHKFEARSQTGQALPRQFINTNTLLWKYDLCIGVKGGISDEAGYVLSAAARLEQVELYSIVLGTDLDVARFDDSAELLDFGFAHFRTQELALEGTTVAEAKVTDYLNKKVDLLIASDLSAPVLDFGGEIERKVSVIKAKAPIKAGDELGVASFFQGDTLVATVPLVASEDVAKPFILLRPIYWIINLVGSIFD